MVLDYEIDIRSLTLAEDLMGVCRVQGESCHIIKTASEWLTIYI